MAMARDSGSYIKIALSIGSECWRRWYLAIPRYAFDVDATTQAFKNRRVFAYIDTGLPDGIQLDTNGNVYSGCGDGVQVSFPSPPSTFNVQPLIPDVYSSSFITFLNYLVGLESRRDANRQILPRDPFCQYGFCGERKTCDHGWDECFLCWDCCWRF